MLIIIVKTLSSVRLFFIYHFNNKITLLIRGICSTDEIIQDLVAPLLRSLAEGYSKLYEDQKDFETLKKYGKDEFFGLRDFYR